MSLSDIVVLRAGAGHGKTAVLRELHRRIGGKFLDMKELVEAMPKRHPLAMEETFYELALDALQSHSHVFIDDLDLLTNVVDGCHGPYPRTGLLNAHLTVLATYVTAAKKKLFLAVSSSTPRPFHERAYRLGLPRFEVEDYRHLCQAYLGPESADRLAYEKIHRFAQNLSARDIEQVCGWLRRDAHLDTDRFIEYLRSQGLTSNVDLEEVGRVDLHELKGVDDVIRSLETNIVAPMENDELATQLQLRPKRGVLLLGPPGTGKTTVGRALAHRLKGKFFRIDGTHAVGGGDISWRIDQVFGAAMENAPSVIFIDDSDVIFEHGGEYGFYRYLLTMLDGLESESARRVCVMMTAMDVASLPPALIRSGRVELWLEMRLPDEAARAAILGQHTEGLPEELRSVEVSRLVAETEEFTGADLKRLVEDAKVLFAYDRAKGIAPRDSASYFLAAARTVRDNKQRYREAEERARLRRSAAAS